MSSEIRPVPIFLNQSWIEIQMIIFHRTQICPFFDQLSFQLQIRPVHQIKKLPFLLTHIFKVDIKHLVFQNLARRMLWEFFDNEIRIWNSCGFLCIFRRKIKSVLILKFFVYNKDALRFVLIDLKMAENCCFFFFGRLEI